MTDDDGLMALAALTTEADDDRFARIDEMSTSALAATMNDADATVPRAVRAALGSIVDAIDGIEPRQRPGRAGTRRLRRQGGGVKEAVLVARGMTPAQATARLAAVGGQLERALS